MKKVLLGTTAIVASLVAGSAMAASPKVTVGGYIDFQTGWSDQDLDTPGTTNTSRDIKFQNDTEVHFMIDGKADNGLGYGAVIELEADVNADDRNEGLNSDRTFVYLEGNWGRSEMGVTAAPSDTMQVDTGTFSRGAGGNDGDWFEYINAGPGGAAFALRPDLPLAHVQGVGEDATKIVYYSPRFSGLQLGVSFAPDSGDRGTSAGFSGENNAGNFENVFQTGVNYEGMFDHVGVNASATGEWGESEVNTTEDLASYALGLSVDVSGFTIGGSWGDWDDSGQVVGSGNDASYWDAGVAYDFGPFGASATYFEGENANNDSQNISLGADYQLAPGLVPYVELNFFELDPAGAGTTDNDGTVLLLGTELTF